MALTQLRESIEQLEERAGYTSRTFRMKRIQRLTDIYIGKTGKRPPNDLLAKMTDIILHEELTDRRVDKMSLEEYPIMSDTQYERRTTGGQRRKRKDGTTISEVPLSHAINIATDRVDYSLPIRNIKK